MISDRLAAELRAAELRAAELRAAELRAACTLHLTEIEQMLLDALNNKTKTKI